MDSALVLLRLAVGGLMIGHGLQKAFGWFGGPGWGGLNGWLGSMRLRPSGFWAAGAIASELGGGLLLALGLLSPLGSLGVIASMLMAIALAHWPRFWASEGGLEYPLVLIAAATAIAISGPGAYSVDALVPLALPALAFPIGLVGIVAGVVVALVTRRPAEPAAPVELPNQVERQAA